MDRYIVCYDAGFVHLGYMVAKLPDDPDDKPIPIDFGISAAELPPKHKRDKKKSATMSNIERILKQVDTVRILHNRYNPVAYFIEMPHSGAKSAAAAKGMAYAIAYLAAALHLLCGRHVVKRFFLPKAVKKCVTGSNKASKLDIARAVLAFWPEIDEWPGFKVITKKIVRDGETFHEEDKAASHDATDAGAVCITATRTDAYKRLWENDDGEHELDF